MAHIIICIVYFTLDEHTNIKKIPPKIYRSHTSNAYNSAENTHMEYERAKRNGKVKIQFK